LQSKTTVTFDDAGRQVSETENSYYEHTPALNQLTKSNSINSKGDTLSQVLQYPIDFSTIEPYDIMIQRHMINQVINRKSFKNATFLQSSKTNFKAWTISNSQVVSPESVELTVGSNPAEKRMLYNGYDACGNPLSVSKPNDVIQTYLWGYGYNNAYPVAKIVGADYNTVAAFVNQSVLSNPPSDQQLRDELNKIRTGLAGSKALVYTYTYAPLVGITSQTDPSNKTTYFEYDGIGRLLRVRDFNNNIIKRYDYHFLGDSKLPVYYNVAESMTYARNTCQLTELGGSYTTSVPAGMFSSIISQDDANQQALSFIQLNGQYNANQNGTCTTASNLINLTFYSSRSIPFTLNFTNLSTNQSAAFQTTGMSGFMGSIIPGNYNVQITCPYLGQGTFSYGFGSYYQENITVGNISNISITTSLPISLY
jgi:YD repeat-containing protein